MEKLQNDIRVAIRAAVQAGIPALQVQMAVKGVADELNNPEAFRHVPAPVEPEPEPDKAA